MKVVGCQKSVENIKVETWLCGSIQILSELVKLAQKISFYPDKKVNFPIKQWEVIDTWVFVKIYNKCCKSDLRIVNTDLLNYLRWSCQMGGRKMRASQLVSEDALKSARPSGSNNGPAWKTAQPDMSDCKSKDMTDLETRWVKFFKPILSLKITNFLTFNNQWLCFVRSIFELSLSASMS